MIIDQAMSFQELSKCHIPNITFVNQVSPSSRSVFGLNEDDGNVDTDIRAMTRRACELTGK